ncbi:MAG: hypothetical protein KJ063_16635 [Anaerolineae bacterium]|nr:hypothetical protein [Anaerolineae bacterium]
MMMRKTRVLFVLAIILALVVMTVPGVMANSGSPARETIFDGAGTGVGPSGPAGPAHVIAGSVLHNNGPVITHPGGGAGGSDASSLQTALGLTIFGFGHALSSGFRVADDFTVTDPGGWQVDHLYFYGYQTGSTTTPTINNINFRIWNGAPNAGGSVVFGDTTTNRLASATWSNIYRAQDTTITNNQRPLMLIQATAGVTLPPGTYWVDWQMGGTLASGPWAPPISILGTTVTGNGLQFDPAGGGVWNALVDGASGQGLPFQVIGSILGGPDPGIVMTKTVGTVPATCATTSSTSAPYGSTVYYCYTVENTGNITLTHHTVVDDVMGTVLGPDASYALVPGATFSFIEPYTLTSESVTNVAVWTASISGTAIVATATGTATVTGSPTDVTLTGFSGGSGAIVYTLPLLALVLLAAAGLFVTLRRQNG